MDVVGTTVDAIGLLLKVLEFYHNYEKIPDRIKTAFERSKESSVLLRTWVHVFQRLDYVGRDPEFKESFATLMVTLDRLKDALDAHRVEVVKWMVKMGFPEPPLEDFSVISNDRDSRPPSLEASQAKKSSSSVFTVAYKLSYVAVGAKVLDALEKTIRDSKSEVMELFLTIVNSTTLASFPHNDPKTDPPIVDFVVAAKRRKEDKVPVNIITETEMLGSFTEDPTNIDERLPARYQIMVKTITPKWQSSKLSAGRYICCKRSGDLDEEESMNLARLFAVDEKYGSSSNRGDGDMLRCSAVVKPASKLYLQYIFRVPPGSSTTQMHTLRTLLVNKEVVPDGDTVPLFSIADRVKFSIRLATAVLVVHSLGLVHKRIHPESIVVIDADSTNQFPRTLGYPYLVGFHLSRSESARTTLQQDSQEISRRGIYFHPREQATVRSEPYSMLSDIYSLGVCLLEIALWKSLFIVGTSDEQNSSLTDYVPDRTSQFEKLSDNYYPSEMSGERRAYKKMAALMEIAKAEIPRTMGGKFAELVVDCLNAGTGNTDDPFTDRDEFSSGMTVTYLNLVLQKLRVVHDGVSGSL